MSAYPLDKLIGEQEHERPDQIMESNTDAEQWRLEVERVAPQLKVSPGFLDFFIFHRCIMLMGDKSE